MKIHRKGRIATATARNKLKFDGTSRISKYVEITIVFKRIPNFNVGWKWR